MPQVSRHKLSHDLENRLFELFWRSLSRLGTPQETAEFFTDILTSTEKLMLAKRYTIAVLLTKGYPPKHVHATLNVSYTTIATVAGWLKNLKPATKKILDRHLKDESWGQFFDKIEAILDAPPPIFAYPKDKSAIGKAKFKAAVTRSARSVLR